MGKAAAGPERRPGGGGGGGRTCLRACTHREEECLPPGGALPATRPPRRAPSPVCYVSLLLQIPTPPKGIAAAKAAADGGQRRARQRVAGHRTSRNHACTLSSSSISLAGSHRARGALLFGAPALRSCSRPRSSDFERLTPPRRVLAAHGNNRLIARLGGPPAASGAASGALAQRSSKAVRARAPPADAARARCRSSIARVGSSSCSAGARTPRCRRSASR